MSRRGAVGRQAVVLGLGLVLGVFGVIEAARGMLAGEGLEARRSIRVAARRRSVERDESFADERFAPSQRVRTSQEVRTTQGVRGHSDRSKSQVFHRSASHGLSSISDKNTQKSSATRRTGHFTWDIGYEEANHYYWRPGWYFDSGQLQPLHDRGVGLTLGLGVEFAPMNSMAWARGFRQGDIIRAVNGRNVIDEADLFLETAMMEGSCQVSVIRDGRSMNFLFNVGGKAR